MTADLYRYRDPLEVLIRDEARTCKGCVHRVTTIILDTEYHHCSKHTGRKHRCRQYDNPSEMDHERKPE